MKVLAKFLQSVEDYPDQKSGLSGSKADCG